MAIPGKRIIPIFNKLVTGIPLVDKVINKIHETITALSNQEILEGQMIGPITLASGDNNVPHLLGRPIQGYMVTRLSASVTIYDKESTSTVRDQFMIIHASGAATAYFWVF